MYFLLNLRAREARDMLICGHLKRDGTEMIAVIVNE